MQTPNTDELLKELHAVVSNAEELVKATAGDANEKLVATRARVEQSLRVAKKSLTSAEHSAIAQVKTAAKSADTYVQENPWRSVGMAAGAGVLIGLLMSRGRH